MELTWKGQKQNAVTTDFLKQKILNYPGDSCLKQDLIPPSPRETTAKPENR